MSNVCNPNININKKAKIKRQDSYNMDIQKEASASAPVIESITTPSGLTIVRLKRKRNEEPLDALGILIILSKSFPFNFFSIFH
jgi:hypothetical protein